MKVSGPTEKVKGDFIFFRSAFLFILLTSLSVSAARAEDIIDPLIVDSQNRFAVKTFQAVYAQKETPNVFFAPLNAGTFLRSLIYFTQGPALPALLSALETGDMSPDEVTTRSAGLWMISQNKEKEEIEIYSPMSVLGNKDVEFKQDFAGRLKFYKIFPKSYDLNHEGMKKSLEEWIVQNSNKKNYYITNYFDPGTPVVFMEGFYFKGRWAAKFETVSTSRFHNAQGKELHVPMLAASGPFEFFKDDAFQAVNVPYGTGLYSLFIFMPSEPGTLSDFVGALTADNLKNWTRQFLERPGRVLFPRFTVRNSIDLRKAFKASGFETIFSPEADFSLIAQAPRRIYLGSMEQSAVIELDGQSVSKPLPHVPELDGSAQQDSFSFKARRPFFFMLRNNKTRAIAGLGAVEDPSLN